MKCKKCGGNKRPDGKCNLCAIFAEGLNYDGVEPNRHNKPKRLLGLKVHPKQRAEAIADAKAKGVPTDFDKEGYPLVSGRSHQKRLVQAYGMVNLDGGYGD